MNISRKSPEIAGSDGTNIFSILVASIVFVLGLTLYFVSSLYSFAFLSSFAAILFIIATFNHSRTMMQFSIFAFIVCMVFTLWPLLYLTGDGSLLSRYEHNNFRTYAYIAIYLVVPLLFALLTTSIILERSVHYTSGSNKFYYNMINSRVFKSITLLLASTVFCLGVALPLFDKIFLFAPIVSLASTLFVANLIRQNYKNSVISAALYTGYALSVQIAFIVIRIYDQVSREDVLVNATTGLMRWQLKAGAFDVGKFTDVIKSKYPISIHNIDIYLVLLPIAIMACLSFIQTVSLYQTQNEQTGSYTTSENGKQEANDVCNIDICN